MPEPIYTIGHSNHSPERFLELLRACGITAIADVRSQPYSRFDPEFSQPLLKSLLTREGIEYVFLGRELGARSSEEACYRDGRVVYDRLAAQCGFQEGLDRLLRGAERHRIALLCAEKEPLDCHRTILVSRHLTRASAAVHHILPDGSTESHDATMQRLLVQLGLEQPDIFRTPEETLDLAYALQEEKIAYQQPKPADPALVA